MKRMINPKWVITGLLLHYYKINEEKIENSVTR